MNAPVRSLAAAVVVFGFGLGLAACGGASGSPAAALDGYGAALRARDYAAAYGFMSEAFRARVSKDEFVRRLSESGRERGETAARLERGYRAVEVTAAFTYGYGDTMRLVQEDGAWRIASDPLELYGQGTPREALRSFVRAYRMRRWDVVLRFVPAAYRERMTVAQVRDQFDGEGKESIAATMKAIEINLDAPIEQRGQAEARMAYGDRGEVKLTLEGDRWMVQDLD